MFRHKGELVLYQNTSLYKEVKPEILLITMQSCVLEYFKEEVEECIERLCSLSDNYKQPYFLRPLFFFFFRSWHRVRFSTWAWPLRIIRVGQLYRRCLFTHSSWIRLPTTKSCCINSRVYIRCSERYERNSTGSAFTPRTDSDKQFRGVQRPIWPADVEVGLVLILCQPQKEIAEFHSTF